MSHMMHTRVSQLQSSFSSSRQRQCMGLKLQHRTIPARHTMRAGSADGAESVESVISLPLFPLPSVLHPAQMGTLLVYEPRHLSLFRDLQATAAPGAELKFGHILAPGHAPPALMQDSVGGLPPSGVCAAVKSIEELDEGKLQVNYQGWRRFKLLTVDNDVKPYPLAAATWLDDDAADSSSSSPGQADTIDELEQQVYALLQQVAKYVQMLTPAAGAAGAGSTAGSNSSAGAGSVLPPSVLLYAPPPPQPSKPHGSADYLVKAGGPTGDRIATWQRMGSVYGNTGAKKKQAQDPYQMARDQLAKERRQELFSFAAASVLELGLPERLALLHSQDTAARLQFVAAAVQPFLADLLARVSVQKAMVQQ